MQVKLAGYFKIKKKQESTSQLGVSGYNKAKFSLLFRVPRNWQCSGTRGPEKGIFFYPSFLRKAQKYPTFSKNYKNDLLFQGPWYHYTASCGVPWKVTKILALLYPATCNALVII